MNNEQGGVGGVGWDYKQLQRMTLYRDERLKPVCIAYTVLLCTSCLGIKLFPACQQEEVRMERIKLTDVNSG